MILRAYSNEYSRMFLCVIQHGRLNSADQSYFRSIKSDHKRLDQGDNWTLHVIPVQIVDERSAKAAKERSILILLTKKF